ncbi:glycosylphosphatidylinositol anchor attachment 1 protein-like [Symsagittifera roscoffensis]|uniref:glycosylphosphatidylinositol anchor attachment 1 protein-like n=1 Tax=Symsagittifera roscoffensis TaxID=84072 RepID=UPI00307BA69E
MGILSDPDRRSSLVELATKYGNLVAVLLYILNFVAFLALFHPMLRERTYFSENALLANQVELTFNSEHTAAKLEREMRELASAKRQMPHDWIVDKLVETDIEAYVQNFTVFHPFMKQPKTGRNVYGIMRAPRHSSTESIVFAIPYDINTVYKSIPLMLALAQHFRNQIYWGKDLIFVFSDSKLNGLQAWLQAYHGHPESGAIKGSRLETRGGSIQAALSIEISQSSCDGLNFILEGMNGQLPNLDLFNVMDKLTRSNDGSVYLHGRRDPPTRDLFQNCLGMVKTSLLGMWQQASGRPVSGHSLFLPYHIDALSIKCQSDFVLAASGRNRIPNMGYANIARTIEGTVRSINNLLERFHQSFFYYIMPSTNNYISIGLYIPALVICLLSSAIVAISLWHKSLEVLHVFEQPDIPSLRIIPDVTSVFRILISAFLLPSAVYFAVPYFNEFQLQYLLEESIDNADILMLTFLMAFLAIVTIPLYMPSLYCQEKLTMSQRQVYKSIAMFLSIIGIGCNCVANFSLTYFIAIIAVPLMNLTAPSKCKFMRSIQKLICLIISPLTIVLVMPVVSFSYSFPGEEINMDVWYSQVKGLISKVVHESYVHNSAMLWQMWALFIPLWLLHWFMLWLPIVESDQTESCLLHKPESEIENNLKSETENEINQKPETEEVEAQEIENEDKINKEK